MKISSLLGFNAGLGCILWLLPLLLQCVGFCDGMPHVLRFGESLLRLLFFLLSALGKVLCPIWELVVVMSAMRLESPCVCAARSQLELKEGVRELVALSGGKMP